MAGSSNRLVNYPAAERRGFRPFSRHDSEQPQLLTFYSVLILNVAPDDISAHVVALEPT